MRLLDLLRLHQKYRQCIRSRMYLVSALALDGKFGGHVCGGGVEREMCLSTLVFGVSAGQVNVNCCECALQQRTKSVHFVRKNCSSDACCAFPFWIEIPAPGTCT